MDNRTTDDLVRIAMAGGGFELDGSRRTTDELVRIAMAGGDHPATIRFTNVAHKTTDDLVRIGMAGRGRAFFVS